LGHLNGRCRGVAGLLVHVLKSTVNREKRASPPPEVPVPTVPVSLLDPVWEQFADLLPERPAVAPTHPLGCHRLTTPPIRY